MSGLLDTRWRAVAALSTVSVALATIVTLTTAIETDHVWALVVAVVAAAVVRAACAGGVTSILSLAGTMVIAQPVMHVLGELTHSHTLAADHSSFDGLVVVAFHVALFVILSALLAAGDTAGRSVVARFRRLVRIVLRTVAPPRCAVTRPSVEPPVRRPKQRLSSRLPARRGPPAALVVLAA